jgi:metallophosphoesterase (TIGR00282 family)
MNINILFFGDIVGETGRNIIKDQIGTLKEKYCPDLVIANGENASAGFGITKNTYDELIDMGIDVITSGNHIWDKKDTEKEIENCPKLIRPYNFPLEQPGKGFLIINAKGVKIGILNLSGRVFMGTTIDCPFKKFDKFMQDENTELVIVDFHGEATSEKLAFGFYSDGRATAVLGTHTHVQTNDDRLMPEGTFYITDVGMSGSLDSVIGVEKDPIMRRFITGLPAKYEVEKKGRGVLSAVFLQIDVEKKKVIHYNKIYSITGE